MEQEKLPPSGEHDFSDDIESHPDFHEERKKKSDEFWKKNNPEYYKLMQKVRGGTDKKTD